MPRFFFDFHGDGDGVIDTEGCEFGSFELAYLDAYRTMVRMGAEMLIEQRDPSRLWIDIRDGAHHVIFTLAFDEIFQRRGKRPVGATADNGGRRSKQYEALSGEIEQACARAKASVASARETIARAEASRVVPQLGW